NDEELIEKISRSSYGFLVDHADDDREVYMERRIKRYMYFYLLSHRKGNQMNLIQTISYLHLLEYEMRDIISILEAVRYGLKPEDAEHFLIRKIYKEGA
ncbi:MAG TPA: V-type ATPase subunit, partial [Clostridiales bacterium]|nr:V-type ATPase subunit [Clostridiales bacterium]